MRFLLVQAHADDETLYAGTLFKLTHNLKHHVDILLITNGEGGFRFATLAEHLYQKELTNEIVARKELPAIRKLEMLASAKLLGIQNVFFLDEQDDKYSTNIDAIVNQGVWNLQRVKGEVKRLLTKNKYDVLLLMLPHASQHAHHKVSCYLALQAVQELLAEQVLKHKPIILAGTENYHDYVNCAEPEYQHLCKALMVQNVPFAQIPSSESTGAVMFVFDRLQGFGVQKRLNYQIVVSWACAQHISQGTLYPEVIVETKERYWMFENFTNVTEEVPIVQQLFEQLNS